MSWWALGGGGMAWFNVNTSATLPPSYDDFSVALGGAWSPSPTPCA
jgi:hypothetical protein